MPLEKRITLAPRLQHFPVPDAQFDRSDAVVGVDARRIREPDALPLYAFGDLIRLPPCLGLQGDAGAFFRHLKRDVFAGMAERLALFHPQGQRGENGLGVADAEGLEQFEPLQQR